MNISLRDGWLLAALAALLIAFKAWLIRAAGVEMHYDEAQYWEWSRQLDWSYYSKGPLVAWLIALSEFLFGHGEWQVRLPAWLAHGALLALVFYFARDVWQDRVRAWWAVVLFLFTPVYFTLGVVMTTDVWLFLFWTWGLWASYRALIKEQPRAWYEVGAAVGLGALTKLSIGLLPAAIGLATVIVPRWRHHLTTRQLWGGLAIMLLLMCPMLLWNAANDWVMLRHEGGHVSGDEWSALGGARFLIGQALVLSPPVVLVALTVLWRPPRDTGQRLLWGLALVWIAFFTFKASGGTVQMNWPAPAYLGPLILFAGHIPALSRLKRGVLYAGLVMSMALMSVAYFPHSFGLHAKQDPFKYTTGWRTPVTLIAHATPRADFILAADYKLAAEFAFYWPREINVYVAGNATRRFNQHDLWPAIDREAGRDGLWISTSSVPPAELNQAFAACQALAPVPAVAPDGGVLRTYYPFHCTDYRPIAWPRPQRY